MKKIYLLMMLTFFVVSTECSAKDESVVPGIKSSAFKHGKPGAHVKLISPALINMNANVLTKLNVVLGAADDSGIMSVNISAGEGLVLTGKTSLYKFSLDKASDYSIPVELSAAANGRYYLNCYITIHNAETVVSKHLAIIVQVGNTLENPAEAIRFRKKGGNENIISLPAEENIQAPMNK